MASKPWELGCPGGRGSGVRDAGHPRQEIRAPWAPRAAMEAGEGEPGSWAETLGSLCSGRGAASWGGEGSLGEAAIAAGFSASASMGTDTPQAHNYAHSLAGSQEGREKRVTRKQFRLNFEQPQAFNNPTASLLPGCCRPAGVFPLRWTVLCADTQLARGVRWGCPGSCSEVVPASSLWAGA